MQVLVPRTSVEYGFAKVLKITPEGAQVDLGDDDIRDIALLDIAPDREPRAAELKVDMNVVGQWTDDKWYPARITEAGPEGFTVLWEDGTSQTLATDRLRLRYQPRPAPAVAKEPAPAPSPGPAPGPSPQPGPGPSPQPGPGPAPGPKPAPPPKDDFGPPLMDILGAMGNSYTYVWKLKTPAVAKGLAWTDGSIDISFDPDRDWGLAGPEMWSFSIVNKTKAPLAIIWDKSWLTSFKGTKRLLNHGDLGRVNFTAAQAPTTVRAGEKLDKRVVPRDGYIIYHHKGKYNDRGEWEEPWDQIDGHTVFFGEDHTGLDGYDQFRKALSGKSFTFHLVTAAGGKEKVYDFTFTLVDIEQKKQEGGFGF